MFCHKCGNKVAESADFCHKCGAKVAHVVTHSAQQMHTAPMQNHISNASAPAIATDVGASQLGQGFRDFVDAHVKATTNFASAEDLLKNGKPSKLILLAAAPGLLLTLYFTLQSSNVIIGLVVLVFFFAILCTFPLRFAVYIVKQELAKKNNVNADTCVDRDDFILFLNNNMNHISADMDTWFSSQVERSALDGEMTDATSCVSTSKGAVTIILPYESAAIKQFKFNISKGKRGNTLGIWSFIFFPVYLYNLILEMSDVGTGEYGTLYKTAPILSGVVKYYLQSRNGK